jgi:hypothetical protein
MTYVLYDSNSNKKINLKKINLQDKLKIINGEYYIKDLTKEFQKELSYDDEHLPLFDIMTNEIKYVHKSNIYKSIKQSHYRVLNEDLINFLKKYNYDNSLIEIVKLFNFDILESIFLRFVFYNSYEIGADISYFKNPAFIKSYDIKPFLKKSSIVNTALNTGIINMKDLPISNNKLEKIYDQIKHFLFTDDILLSHMELIKKNKLNGLINFYTFYGSSFLNNYLRQVHNVSHDNNFVEQINKLNDLIDKVPKLKEPKLVFRFINDDSYLNINKVGDTFINNSFMSCTRKPNINAENNEFGFILLKINLTDKFKGYFISIEASSVFPHEKEIIIKPGVKFRLKSIDDNVEFYLFEHRTKYLRNIKKKYELEIVEITEWKIPKYDLIKIPEVNLKNVVLEGSTGEEKVDYFMNTFCRINSSCYLVLPNGNKKLFYCNYYNSTELYNKFYYYKTIKGFFMFSFDENQNIDIFIEFGDELIVNYPSKYLSINEMKDTKIISSLLANTFEMEMVRTFPIFKSINQYIKKDDLVYENIKFNDLLYDIIFDQIKDTKIHNYNEIIKFLNEKVNEKNIQFALLKIYEKNITYKTFIKKIFKDYEYIKFLLMSLPVNISNCHYIYNASEHLLNNDIVNIKSMIGIYSMFNKEINLDIDDSVKIDFSRENSVIKN